MAKLIIERGEIHNVLKSNGWKHSGRVSSEDGERIHLYTHSNYPGHNISVTRDGEWFHDTETKFYDNGRSHHLKDYLNSTKNFDNKEE
jgi:hypothetical protein